MPIDKSEVLRIARLARCRIDPDEAEGLAGDLERIVAHIDRLSEVDLPDDAERLTYFDADHVRPDRAEDGLSLDEVLRNAPATDGTFFLVPQIVDKDEGDS